MTGLGNKVVINTMKSKSTQGIFRNVDRTSKELPEITEQFLAVSKERKSNAGRKPRYSTAMVPLNARIPPDVKAKMIERFGGVQAAVDELIIEALQKGDEHQLIKGLAEELALALSIVQLPDIIKASSFGKKVEELLELSREILGIPEKTVAQLDERPSLVEALTDIRDTARSGLPSSAFTVEQSQQIKLNEIAGKLTRVIDGLKDKGEKNETANLS